MSLYVFKATLQQTLRCLYTSSRKNRTTTINIT